jgi:hypothetical protein
MKGRRIAYRRNGAIGSETDKGQEYKAEPSRTRVNQWNLGLASLDALFPDVPSLSDRFKAVHEELGGDSHERNGDYDDSKASPRVGFRFLHRQVMFHFLECLGCGWVECEGVVLAGGICQENTRADVAKAMVSVGRGPMAIPIHT